MTHTLSAAESGQLDMAVENASASQSGDASAEDPIGSVPTGPAESTTSEPTTPEPTTTTEAPPPASETPDTTATPSAPPTTTNRPQVTQEEQVVTLVNAARERSGCGPVRIVGELVDAARGHSADMAQRDYFDHTTPDGVGFADRIIAAGYSEPGAENIARGQRSATQVMNSWMESDGHRANILNCQLTAIGVGLDKDGWYWTQNFGY
ncbi:CAP domain-containing protein [Actinophytocola sediminis]